MRAHSRIAILVLAGAMLLTACGGDDPDTTVYRDADNRSLFKLPNDWNLYRADELSLIAPVPFVPDLGGYRPISFVAFDGKAMDAPAIDQLASLPTREEALARLMSVLLAPATSLARTVAEPHAGLVRVVDAMRTARTETA